MAGVLYAFADCELDPHRLELRRGGQAVPLQPKPLELLFYLVQHRDRAVSKEELLDALWPDSVVTENSLTRVVSLARLAVGEREGAVEAIRTLPRVGYRFVSDVAEREAATEPSPAAATTAGPAGCFVGRSALLDDLERAWLRAAGGRGQLALLSGEAGIGKTRLAEALAERARSARAHVVTARCPAARGTPAFWPFVQLLRQLVSEENAGALRAALGPGADEIAHLVPVLRAGDSPAHASGPIGEEARFLLCDGVASLLARSAREQPLLVLVEDLQWADPPSLLLLRYLAPTLRDASVMLVATLRPPPSEADSPLAEALADLVQHEHCRRHALEGFGEEEVAALVETRRPGAAPWRLVKLLHQRTEGNPFFIREAVQWLEDRGLLDAAELGASIEIEIPPGVREVIRSRTSRVSEPCRHALAVASLIGREFAVHLLEPALEQDRPEILALLDEATAAGLAAPRVGRPGRFAFDHDLVREVLSDALSAGQRARLHQRIGQALEELHADDPEPPVADLAHHFHHALATGEEERAIRYALAAADQARDLLAAEDEALHVERALHALESLGGQPQRRLELLLRLAEAQLASGSAAGTRKAALRAAQAARALGDQAALVDAALRYGGLVLWAVPASEERRALLEEALAAVGPEASAERAQVLARLVAERPDAEVGDAAHAQSLEAIEIARKLDDVTCLAEALHARHFVLQGPDHLEERAALAREVLDLGDHPERSFALHENEAADALTLGDVARCRHEMALAEETTESVRYPAFLWLCTANRASLALLEGRLEDAEALAREALALGQRTANPNAGPLFVGHAHLLARERGRMGDLAATIAPHARELHWIGTYARVGFVGLFADLGQTDEARKAFRAFAEAGFDSLPRRDDWLASLAELAKQCADLGEAQHAPALEALLAPQLGRHAVYQGALFYLGPVSRSLAHLAAVQGRHEQARSLLARAETEAEAVESPPWVARIRRELAAL